MALLNLVSLPLALLLAGVGASRMPKPPADDGKTVVEQLSPEEVRARVEGYLGSIDTPIAASRWRALGPQATKLLAEIAQGDGLPTRRARALDGLAAVGGHGAAELLTKFAQKEDEPQAVQLAAIRGASRLLPSGKLWAALKPVLESAKDLHVRAQAADALAHRGRCAAVKAQAAREKDEEREAFGRALERCK